MEAARERLSVALATTNSVRSGAKKFTIPINPESEDIITQKERMPLKKGQEFVKIHDEESTGFWHETLSTTKDKTKEAVCAACGKPAAREVVLKQCSGCRQVLYALLRLVLLDSGHLIISCRYCSAEHQKVRTTRLNCPRHSYLYFRLIGNPHIKDSAHVSTLKDRKLNQLLANMLIMSRSIVSVVLLTMIFL